MSKLDLSCKCRLTNSCREMCSTSCKCRLVNSCREMCTPGENNQVFSKELCQIIGLLHILIPVMICHELISGTFHIGINWVTYLNNYWCDRVNEMITSRAVWQFGWIRWRKKRFISFIQCHLWCHGVMVCAGRRNSCWCCYWCCCSYPRICVNPLPSSCLVMDISTWNLRYLTNTLRIIIIDFSIAHFRNKNLTQTNFTVVLPLLKPIFL